MNALKFREILAELRQLSLGELPMPLKSPMFSICTLRSHIFHSQMPKHSMMQTLDSLLKDHVSVIISKPNHLRLMTRTTQWRRSRKLKQTSQLKKHQGSSSFSKITSSAWLSSKPISSRKALKSLSKGVKRQRRWRNSAVRPWNSNSSKRRKKKLNSMR